MSIEVKMGQPQEIPTNDINELGVRALVNKDANVLVANNEHKNFTETKEIIPKGSIIFGQIMKIQGLRRGQPFEYRLFRTNDNKLIYLNNLEIMRTTEVTLGADQSQTPTVVDMKGGKKNFTAYTIGGAIAGAGLGWYFAKKMRNMESRKANMFILGGAVLGFFAGKYIEKRRPVTVKKSK